MSARLLLEKLLRQHERNPDRVTRSTVRPNYAAVRTAQQMADLHEGLNAAKRVGAVELVPDKRERSHLIARIVLLDADRLADHLGLLRQASVALQTKNAVLTSVELDDAARELLDRCAARWAIGQSSWGLSASSATAAVIRFRLLSGLRQAPDGAVSPRIYSVNCGVDSKGFEHHERHLRAMVREWRPDLAKLDSTALWQRFGISRYPHPIYVTGPVQALSADGLVIDARVRPFLGIHPESWLTIRAAGSAGVILTIENLASFNRYVREIPAGDIVLYLGGFPSPEILRFLNAILEAFPNASFFHWGDIDAGGVRIFSLLERCCRRRPLPHMMSVEIAERYGQSAKGAEGLDVELVGSRIAELALYLTGPNARTAEQENLDPIRPQIGDAVP